MTYSIKSQDVNLENFPSLSCVIENLSLPERKVMNIILYLTGHHQKVWVCQSTLAAYAGISREWCNRLLSRLRSLGLIGMINRGYDGLRQKGRTCLYSVADWFGSDQTRFSLQKYFPALRQQSLIHFTQYIINITESYRNRKGTARSDTTKRVERTVFSQKGETVSYEASKAIQNVNVIKLTRAGQIQLSGFPDEAVLYAQKSMARKPLTSLPTTPFAYFYGICKAYCARKSIPLDYDVIRTLKRQNGISFDAAMTETVDEVVGTPLQERIAERLPYAKKLEVPSDDVKIKRTCAQVAEEIAKMRAHKKSNSYVTAAQFMQFDSFTDKIEQNIRDSAECDGACDYCLKINRIDTIIKPLEVIDIAFQDVVSVEADEVRDLKGELDALVREIMHDGTSEIRRYELHKIYMAKKSELDNPKVAVKEKVEYKPSNEEFYTDSEFESDNVIEGESYEEIGDW